MSAEELPFFDVDALLYRLHEGLARSNKDVLFVVGAPLTASHAGKAGVADVGGVIELIREEFAGKTAQLDRLDRLLEESSNPYQTAFDFLGSRVGQDAANQIIKSAVSHAIPRASETVSPSLTSLADEHLKALESDLAIWNLAPGVEALGQLIANFPNRFGETAITSNFDPLIEIAIRRAGGAAWRTSLSADGSIFLSDAAGCQVIHIHGYWHGNDTLHTNRQLLQKRPSLRNDLLKIIEDKIVVVVGYGGWPDIFTESLAEAVKNDNLLPEVLWTFYGEKPTFSPRMLEILTPGIDRNRVTLYCGVDCNSFLPNLNELWLTTPIGSEIAKPAIEESPSSDAKQGRSQLFKLAPLDCDRPPSIEVWVGREEELRAIEASKAKIVIVCGIGGEGKSVLAAHYISNLASLEGDYTRWDWRDCKEQSDRIRTQIVEIIVRLSDGIVSGEDLQDARDIELVDVLIDYIEDTPTILVFDNVDSYVDLVNDRFTGLLDTLVQRVSESNIKSRVIITCRPDVHYPTSSAITLSMKGISVDEALELFKQRAGENTVPEEDIREAHTLTNGHAFWLDLLAVQSLIRK